MSRGAFALALLLALGGCTLAPDDPPARAAATLVERPDVRGPAPLLILLHGAALSGALTRELMPIAPRARAAGIALALPDAQGLAWNEGSLARDMPGLAGADDIAMLDALIDRLVAEGVADPRAIHLAGISLGGMMAAHYACRRAERLASLVLFKATMPPPGDPPCQPARPLPVLLVAGTADPIVRWNGEVVAGGLVVLQRRRSVPEGFAFWVAANGCGAPREPVALPRLGAPDAPAAFLHEAQGCRGGVPTRLIEVRGGGHRLPGGEELALLGLFGRTTQDVEASGLLVDFIREVEASSALAAR